LGQVLGDKDIPPEVWGEAHAIPIDTEPTEQNNPFLVSRDGRYHVNNVVIDRMIIPQFNEEEFHEQQRRARFDIFKAKYTADLSELAKTVESSITEPEVREIAERECLEYVRRNPSWNIQPTHNSRILPSGTPVQYESMETYMNLWREISVLRDVMRETEGRGDPMTISEARERLAQRAEAQRQDLVDYMAWHSRYDYERRWWRHDRTRKEIVWARLEEDDRNFLIVALKWVYFIAFYQNPNPDAITRLPPDAAQRREIDNIGFPLVPTEFIDWEMGQFMGTIQWMLSKLIIREDVGML
jgi:hypothetical protein